MTEDKMATDDKISHMLMSKGYKLGKIFAEGTYCKVKIAYYTDGGKTKKMACKIVNKGKASEEFIDHFLPRELHIVQHFKHEHIVNVHKIFEAGPKVYLFMDLCERGDLLDFISDKGPLPEPPCRRYFRQLVSAVSYLHNEDICHRDLKCENILLEDEHRVKIADFGFARKCSDSVGTRILSRTFCGSAAYAAPEVITGTPYNPKMYDVWSLGCILYIMLLADMPFDDSNLTVMLKCQKKKYLHFPNDGSITSSAKKLVLQMLEPDVTRRTTIRQVEKSSWLRISDDKERTPLEE